MKSHLQSWLISVYGRAVEQGVLNQPGARRAYEKAYWAYKAVLEAGPVHHLQSVVPAGSLVVDVGANIGFFTERFARWVGGNGRVLAIEPEPDNCEQLRVRLRRRGLVDRVLIIEAAATSSDGRTWLELNPRHPGDHRVGASGLDVVAVKVDTVVAEHPGRVVSLIKIDVQGAEGLVLAGAERTIAVHRPALFVEIDDDKLRDFGGSAASLVAVIRRLGYEGHILRRGGIGATVPPHVLIARHEYRYGDVLFLPRG